MRETRKKFIIAALTLVMLATAFSTRPRTARAIFGINDVTWIACLPFDFNCTKEGVLDPIATGIVNSMIRQIRAATVNWIIKGDMEIKKPFFVTSFIADPQRIADNAARLFLSELTGINFCSFHPNVRTVQGLTLTLDFNSLISCSGPNRTLDNSIGDGYLSVRGDYNYSQTLLTAVSEKSKTTNRAVSAWLEEVRAGAGFLGQRDPKTGKIKTPGTTMAGTILGVRNAEDISNSTQKELFNAIVDIIDTAIGQTIQKGLLEPMSR